MSKPNEPRGRDLDRDPETGQPEDHPGGIAGGATLGAAAGGVTGAAIAGAATGTIAGGPIGMVAGAIAGIVAGSVIGGVTGKAVAERVNPAHEDDYWRGEFARRPYGAGESQSWDDYRPAFRLGYEASEELQGRPFDEAEPQLAERWEAMRGSSRLDWNEARPAVRDAYARASKRASEGPG